jgi:flagellar biosynthesis anti-sigma factor FlgM
MNIQNTGGVQGPQPVQPNRTVAKAYQAQTTPKTAKVDQAEISDQARFLEKLSRLPEVRTDKVEAARAAIAEGAYDSEDKVRAAVERLLDESL